MTIDVSVIIPALNQESTLAACLRSLEDQEFPRERFEIIVVDNGSTDGTREVIEQFPVTYVFEEKRTSYAARNRGIEHASGRLLAFLDGDCRADRSWLSSAVATLDDSGPDLLAGRIVATANDDPNLFEVYDGLKYLNQERSVDRKHYGATANLFVRRDVMDELGGFDGNLVSGGDRELCLRARESGKTLEYSPESTVYHGTRSTLHGILEKNERLGYGTAQILKKRPGQFRAALPTILFMLPRRRFLGDLLRGDTGRSRLLTLQLFLLDWFAKQSHALGCVKAALGIRRGPADGATAADGAPCAQSHDYPTWILVATLVLMVAVAFANGLGNEFCFDDRPYIENSPEIHDIRNVPGMFGLDGDLSYRPVRQASYALDIWIWGTNPFGFHLTNLILHAATTILLSFFVRMLAGSTLTAWVAAALFALHPIHTESVTYISGRKDVLCTFFGLLSMISFQRILMRARSLRWWSILGHAIACVLTLALAVGSKEMALAFIPLMAVLFLLPRIRDAGVDRRLRAIAADTVRVLLRHRYSVGFVLLVCVGMLIVFTTSSRASSAGYHGGSGWNTFQTVARIQVLYLYRMIAPITLIGDYHAPSFRVSDQPFDIESFVAMGFLAVVLLGLLAMTRRSYLVALGGIWYFVSMIPVSHIRPHHELLAERFLYLPSIGFCLALAAALRPALTGRFRRKAIIGLTLLLIAYGVRTHVRNRDWKDDMTFWSVTRDAAPDNARAHIYYAYNLYYAGNALAAIEAAEEGLALHEQIYSGHYNLARMYESIGSHDAAIENYLIELSMFDNEDAYFNLASLYGRLGRYAEAERAFLDSMKRFPPTPDIHYYLGVACEKQNKLDDARRWYRKTLRLDPRHALADRQLRQLGSRARR